MPVSSSRALARPLALTLTLSAVLVLLLSAALVLVQPQPASAAVTSGQAVVDRAAQEYGKPYAWGATGPGSFDCSGFTGYVYRSFGITLPRTSRDQYAAVPHVPTGQEQPGDLIFTYNSGGIYHVGIYAGNGQQWAATKTGDIVRPQSMFSRSYYVGRPAGVTAVTSAILAKWTALGGAGSALGQPTSGEMPTADRRGQVVRFQGGSIFAGPGTGVHEVRGAIQSAWGRLGSETSALGYPTSDELGNADRRGRHNDFQNGSIFHSAATGSHEVRGAIRTAWGRLGSETSALGYPTTDELPTGDGRGSYNDFEHGSIVHSSTTGSHEVRGVIRERWATLGGTRSVLGYPTTDEQATAGVAGRLNRFERGGIWWSRATGAHEVHGATLARYAELGSERSALGLPVSDEQPAAGGGRVSRFEHGAITWTPTGGAVVTPA